MARKRASMREGPLAELFRATEAAQRAQSEEQRNAPPSEHAAERPQVKETPADAQLPLETEAPTIVGESVDPDATVEHVYDFEIGRADREAAPASAPSRPEPVVSEASPEPEPQADTRSELRAWMKDNASLLSNTTMLLSIAALALSLLPGTGFVEPYIQALLFGAAFVLLMELHHQWPSDLQLHGLRRPMVSQPHSWRMVGFAFLFQAATAIFAVWAVLANPLILFPLTALGVVFAFRRWYFRRFGQNWIGVAVGILSLVAAILISELLMVIAWAALTGEQVTLEIWIDERDTFEIRD